MTQIEVFRPMETDAAKRPRLGKSSTRLGARQRDVRLDNEGNVTDIDGPSVATHITGVHDLPAYLHPFIPRLLPVEVRSVGKKCKCGLFRFENPEFEPFQSDKPISQDLKVMIKKQRQNLGYIAAAIRMDTDSFHERVQATVDSWKMIDWEAAAQEINRLASY